MNLLDLYCHVDDFIKAVEPELKKHLFSNGLSTRNRNPRMSDSEIIVILIYFHYSRFRDFKQYYLTSIMTYHYKEFPNALSYKRFVALISRVFPLVSIYLHSKQVNSEGISFIDSTSIMVCHAKRIKRNKVFKEVGALGYSTKGWFFGFKLHLICNHRGEIVSCHITPGNVDDRTPVLLMTDEMIGKLYGDKGYIDKKLFDTLFERGLQLVTGIKKNMKNKLVPQFDKIMLRKRAVIESINNQLKNVFQIEHSRHRKPLNAIINILCGVIAYMHYPNKPSLNLSQDDIMLLQQI